jgi:hypothetical protein
VSGPRGDEGARLNTHLSRTLSTIEAAVAGMTAEQWTRAPQGKWSAEAVLEHLDLTFAGMVHSLRRGLEKGHGARPRSWLALAAQFAIVDLGYFPRGLKSPEGVVPAGGRGAGVVDDIRRHLVEMDETMRECEVKLGRGATFTHPRLGPMTVRQWRRFHLVHARHHMKQIARLRAS